MKPLHNFLRSDTAATAVEYAVMLGLVILVAAAAILALGNATAGRWDDINTKTAGAGLGKN